MKSLVAVTTFGRSRPGIFQVSSVFGTGPCDLHEEEQDSLILEDTFGTRVYLARIVTNSGYNIAKSIIPWRWVDVDPTN
jgi:hypothetical protein